MSTKDSQGRNPFFVAVEDAMDTESDNLKVSETVLGLGSDLKVDEPKKDAVAPLLTVCRRLLVSQNWSQRLGDYFSRASPQPVSGRTALHFSTDADQEEITMMLLKSGADPRIQSSRGSTPFFLACEMGKAKSAEALIQHGVEVSITNNSITTPLHRAAGHDRAARINFPAEAAQTLISWEIRATPLSP
ncbi:ankyrin repeat-containing domain protein [Ilyonectria sp. MPI-CAGE-AT-0026]|nr:ankyrin repeat-containing domain protein [Ilyonectria sp. MPI-CAGE-AT-0026]